MSEFSCEACQNYLFDLVDNELKPLEKQRVQQHIDHCEDCQAQLSAIWEMQAVASRWQDKAVPHWQRRETFFESRWAPRLQWASSFASVFVLVLVLGQVKVDFHDGLSIRFGGDFIDQQTLEQRLTAFEDDQQQQLQSGLQKVSEQQLASDQLLLRTLLDTSRKERGEDLRQVVNLIDEYQDQRTEQTNESLRYLIASQVEDKRNIEQLTRAILRSNVEGSNL
ncbi:MAG: zf-HC2 domain-containing protein [Pseudomonadales bacterium]|nr:zf-HC2 domain-containing protein [Pseudomonadales bacterium]